MSRSLLLQRSRPSPTLNTIIMVENTIKNSKNSVITIPEIKRSLPRQVNHNTLMIILEYLEANGKIYVGLRGITWVQNTNSNLRKIIAQGRKI
jgi:hypothetical protein